MKGGQNMIKDVIANYTSIRLKDGRTGAIVEVYTGIDRYGKEYIEYDVDIDKGPESWETIGVRHEDILEIID